MCSFSIVILAVLSSQALGDICWNTSSDQAGGFESGPWVSGDVLLFEGPGLVAVSAYNMSKLWRMDDAPKVQFVSPTTILLGTDGFESANAMSIDPRTGAKKWQFSDPSMGSWVRFASDGKVMVGAGRKSIISLDAVTGKQQWSMPLPTPTKKDCKDEFGMSHNCEWYNSGIAVHGDHVAFGTEEGEFYAEGFYGVVDASTQKVLWSKPGSPRKGLVFIEQAGRKILLAHVDARQHNWPKHMHDGAKLFAHDAATGEELWSKSAKKDEDFGNLRSLSCGLIQVRDGSVIQPVDGSVVYTAGYADGNAPQFNPVSTEEFFVENGAMVARDCKSGSQVWKTSLPAIKKGAWQAPVALQLSRAMQSTCRPDVVTIDYYMQCAPRGGGCTYFSAAVAMKKDSEEFV